MINISLAKKNTTVEIFSNLSALLNKELIAKLNKFLLGLDGYLAKEKESKRTLIDPGDEMLITFLIVFLIANIVLKNHQQKKPS
ncbi:MAG TPA: hypothetical protein GX692_08560 [Acholeplasmataceae bacterium]|nr:hypothetical protein [Acholeplasmataceae bacterium]